MFIGLDVLLGSQKQSMYIEFWWINVFGKDSLEDQDTNGKSMHRGLNGCQEWGFWDSYEDYVLSYRIRIRVVWRHTPEDW